MAKYSTVDQHQTIENKTENTEYTTKIVWFNVILFLFLHAGFFYGVYLAITSAYIKTYIFCYTYGAIGGFGVSAGAHRLWSHRSYKARRPLRVLLCILFSIAAQNDIYVWCRDHRVHHKFTETDADPHNIKRGFFFAHMGWLMCNKHPTVSEKGKAVDLSDLLEDPVVRFHRRYYIPMILLFSLYLPIMIPVWFWGETLWNSFFTAGMMRYCQSLHYTWLVNSVAHYIGDKPFDKYIEASENAFVSFLVGGEGWHNYHHVFPWDYATSELGYTFNLTKIFIDMMTFVGLAYDLKTAHPELVKNRKLNTGDGTRLQHMEVSEDDLTSIRKTS